MLSLPVLLVAAGFGAIVWLAYVEGQSTALGEPPLVRAIPEPIRVSPDPELASNDDSTVEDLLEPSADRPSEAVLQPPPEEPILTDPDPDPELETAARPPSPAPEPAEAVDDGGQQTAALAEDPALDSPTASPQSTTSPAPAASPESGDLLEPSGGLEPAPVPEASQTADPAPTAEPETPDLPTAVAPPPAPQRPTPPPSRVIEPTVAQPAAEPQQAEIARVSPAPEQPAVARVSPAPIQPAGPQISPSGVEQAPTAGATSRERLRLEPPPPVLARAPSPTETPAASGSPPIVSAPGDDGRSVAQPTYRIQLASVREEADARRAWDLYRLELGDVLADFDPVIERAEIANGTFYRVQAGAFGDRLEAEAICEELKGRNTACLVVRR